VVYLMTLSVPQTTQRRIIGWNKWKPVLLLSCWCQGGEKVQLLFILDLGITRGWIFSITLRPWLIGWMKINVKECRRKQLWPNSVYYNCSSLLGLRKNHEKLSQDTWSLDWDM
jgi:hypothetical protein